MIDGQLSINLCGLRVLRAHGMNNARITNVLQGCNQWLTSYCSGMYITSQILTVTVQWDLIQLTCILLATADSCYFPYVFHLTIPHLLKLF